MWHDLYLGDDPHPRRYARREDALQAAVQFGRLNTEGLAVLAALGVVEPPEAPLRVRLSRVADGEDGAVNPQP